MSFTNAVTYPGTMMIMSCHAMITLFTMFSSQRLFNMANCTIFVFDKKYCILIFIIFFTISLIIKNFNWIFLSKIMRFLCFFYYYVFRLTLNVKLESSINILVLNSCRGHTINIYINIIIKSINYYFSITFLSIWIMEYVLLLLSFFYSLLDEIKSFVLLNFWFSNITRYPLWTFCCSWQSTCLGCWCSITI